MATGGPAKTRMGPEGESGEDSDTNRQTFTTVTKTETKTEEVVTVEHLEEEEFKYGVYHTSAYYFSNVLKPFQ